VTVICSTLPKPPTAMRSSALFTASLLLGALISQQEMGSTVSISDYGFPGCLTDCYFSLATCSIGSKWRSSPYCRVLSGCLPSSCTQDITFH